MFKSKIAEALDNDNTLEIPTPEPRVTFPVPFKVSVFNKLSVAPVPRFMVFADALFIINEEAEEPKILPAPEIVLVTVKAFDPIETDAPEAITTGIEPKVSELFNCNVGVLETEPTLIVYTLVLVNGAALVDVIANVCTPEDLIKLITPVPVVVWSIWLVPDSDKFPPILSVVDEAVNAAIKLIKPALLKDTLPATFTVQVLVPAAPPAIKYSVPPDTSIFPKLLVFGVPLQAVNLKVPVPVFAIVKVPFTVVKVLAD